MGNTSSGPRSGQLPQDVHVQWSGRDQATHWLLFALAVVAGIQTGGVIFDTLVNDPVWSDSVVAARAWNEDIDPSRFYIAFTNGVFLLAIVTLVVGWRSPRPVRGWLRWATGFFIIAVVLTIVYFLPEIQEIRGASAEPIPDGELSDRIQRWTLLDPVRELFIFAGFVLTVRAVGLSHAAQARTEMLSEGPVAAIGSSMRSLELAPIGHWRLGASSKLCAIAPIPNRNQGCAGYFKKLKTRKQLPTRRVSRALLSRCGSLTTHPHDSCKDGLLTAVALLLAH